MTQLTILRPTGQVVPSGVVQYTSGHVYTSATTTADANFDSPYNRLTDGGIVEYGTTGTALYGGSGTDYRGAGAAGTNFAPVLAARVTSADCHTTINTQQITCADAQFTTFDVGSPISGTNIPAGSYITGVTNATTATISQNATASGTTTTLTIGDTTAGTPASRTYAAFLFNNFKPGGSYLLNLSFSGFSMPTNGQLRGVYYTALGCIIDDPFAPYENSVGCQLLTTLLFQAFLQNSTALSFTAMNKTFGINNGLVDAGASNSPMKLTGPSATLLWDYTAGLTKGKSRAITAADINNMRLQITAPLSPNGAAETRVYQVWLNVNWNMQPSATGLTVPNTRTQSPTLSWTYFDADGDTQDSYRVRVWKTADCVGTFDPNTASTWPTVVHDSGKITSNAGSYQIPAGVLRAGVQYRAFVYVTDAGSNGRTNYITNNGPGGTSGLTYAGSAQNVATLANTTLTLSATTNIANAAGHIMMQTDRGWAEISYTGTSGATLLNCNLVGGWGYLLSGQSVIQDQGLDFTPVPDPVLQPWIDTVFTTAINTTTGALGTFTGHAKYNLLTDVDAGFETAGAANLGAWTSSGFGTGGTLTTTTTTAQVFKGTASAKATMGSASLGTPQITSGVYRVDVDTNYTGSVLTATAKVAQAQTTARRAFDIGIAWYSDAAGTALITTSQFVGQYVAAVVNQYTTAWTQAVPPANALSARIVITFVSPAVNEVFYVDCVGLTPHTFNLLDDGGFGNAAPSGSVGTFWTFALGALSAMYWVDGGFTDTYATANGGLTTSTDVGKAVQFTASSAATYAQTWSNLGIMGAKYRLSGYALATSNTDIGIPVQGAVQYGFNLNTLTLPSNPATASSLPIGTWTRFSQTFDATGMTTAQSCQLRLDPGTALHPQVLTLDGIQLERQWAFTHGDFENGVNGNSLANLAPSLGEANDWAASVGASGTANYTNNTDFAPHGGTLQAKLVAPPNTTTTLYQPFTVVGCTTLAVTAWVENNNVGSGSQCQVEWYDFGGVLLTTWVVGTRSNNQATYAQMSLGATGIPYGAYYAIIRFVCVGSFDAATNAIMRVDDVVVTLGNAVTTGPYNDGGWSSGSVQQNGAYLLFERSTANTAPWSTVRLNSDSLTNSLLYVADYTNNWELNFVDYEWPGNERPDVTSNLYYRARLSVGTATSTLQLTSGNSLSLYLQQAWATSNWLLIDPTTTSDNVTLQVKPNGVKIETPETMQQFVALGRPRKVIIGDTVLGDEITLSLITVLPADWVALQNQVNKQTPLYLQSPDGESWTVRATKRTRERIWTGSYVTRPLRNVDITFVTVDPV